MKLKCDLETLKAFRPTTEQIKATENLLISMAKVETIKPIVEKYQNAILKKHQFKINEKWLEKRFKESERIILKESQTYLLSESDFKVYLSECRKEQEKNGFFVPVDCCPLLIAQSKLIDAKRTFVNSLEPLTGIKWNDININLDLSQKYIDLNLSMMTKFIDKESCLKTLKEGC